MVDRYHSVAFNPTLHDATAFDSGEPALDDWLRQHADTGDRRGQSRTYVWIDGTASVVGDYTR